MIFFVFIIVDNTRLIGRLGTNFPVPVEVFPVALGRAGNKKIRGYGNYAPAGKRERRTGGDRKHNLVLDVRFRDIGPASEKDHRCRESGGISARSGSYWVRVGGNKLFWDDYVQ